ncbi:MAG: S1 RNA-binding domain-containing protein [Anaerolineae bacterium]
MEGRRAGVPPLQKPGALAEQLSRGQRVEGIVTKITEFGAFVDIGIGRDGMIHITELSLGPVEKVSEVVQEGQQVVAWVKEVNLKKNRISLTLVDPNRKKIRDLSAGMVIKGTVTRLAPYGAFVDIGAEREAMLHVKEMGTEYVKNPGQVVKPGDTIEARILAVDKRRRRVDLTLKPEEPAEPAPAPAAAEPAPTQPEEEYIPTLMELALREALERQQQRERKARKRKERPEAGDDEYEELLSRTLELHRQGS